MFGGNEPTPLPTDGGCVGAGNCLTFGGWMRNYIIKSDGLKAFVKKDGR
jgi:hypothetical protein